MKTQIYATPAVKGLMLGKRRKKWPNIKLTLLQPMECEWF